MKPKTRKFLSFVLCLALMTGLLWGCSSDKKSSENQAEEQSDAHNERTQTKAEREKLAEKCFISFYSSNPSSVSNWCPPAAEQYLRKYVYEEGWAADSVSVEVRYLRPALEDERDLLSSLYRDKLSYFPIDEGYYYDAQIKFFNADGSSQERSSDIVVMVVKSKGRWYAVPAEWDWL